MQFYVYFLCTSMICTETTVVLPCSYVILNTTPILLSYPDIIMCKLIPKYEYSNTLRADWPWGQRELNGYYLRSYSTLILPVAEYGCDIWFVTWREVHRLVVFEIMVLRRTFIPKRDEVTREWRKTHNAEFYDL